MVRCKICSSSTFSVVYEGPIRIEKFGNVSDTTFQVKKCESCSAISLPNIIENQAEFYESGAYRQEVDGGAEAQDYFRLHDGEQLKHLTITGTSDYRNKIVADVGCGAGSFLDYIHNVCQRAIAIEPSTLYRTSLAERGFVTYPYTSDALADYANKIEIAVSFSVVEHIEDPLIFLKEIHQLLSQNGKLIISTPNADDVLLEAIPDVYASFFYRKAHLWYFNQTALKNLLEIAGYGKIRIIPHHRFGLANLLTWLKDEVPKGNVKSDFVTSIMDSVWKAELERTMRCDYLFAEAIHT